MAVQVLYCTYNAYSEQYIRKYCTDELAFPFEWKIQMVGLALLLMSRDGC